MTVQHMALVFGADGLNASEKLLLLAYCNHTDAHGYCWPSIARLADETGMSVRTIHRTNNSLRAKGLIKSVRRVNPKTGESITNLTRINLALLASMQRPARDYGDNLVEQITFDDQTPSDLPMCQSDTPPVSNCHGGGVTVAPKPSVETSVEPPPPPVPQSAPEKEEEGEATPEKGTEPATGDHGETAAALIAELPTIAARAGRPLRPLLPGETSRLAQAITAAIARGWTPGQIRAVLEADLDSARSVVATWLHRLRGLGDPPAPAQDDATAAQREAQARARAERAEMETRRARDAAAHAARARAILAAARKSA